MDFRCDFGAPPASETQRRGAARTTRFLRTESAPICARFGGAESGRVRRVGASIFVAQNAAPRGAFSVRVARWIFDVGIVPENAADSALEIGAEKLRRKRVPRHRGARRSGARFRCGIGVAKRASAAFKSCRRCRCWRSPLSRFRRP
jgi:hypothetical protein